MLNKQQRGLNIRYNNTLDFDNHIWTICRKTGQKVSRLVEQLKKYKRRLLFNSIIKDKQGLSKVPMTISVILRCCYRTITNLIFIKGNCIFLSWKFTK